MKKNSLIIVVVVVAIVAGIAYFVANKKSEEPSKPAETQTTHPIS